MAPPQSSKAISTDTQSLLKGLMKESGLTASQQRRLMTHVNSGKGLPKTCNPTSSEPTKRAAVSRKAPGAVNSGRINVKTYSGGKRQLKSIKPVVRDQQPITAHYTVDRETQKNLLSDTMTFGKDGAKQRYVLRESANRGMLSRKPRSSTSETAPADEFDSTWQEIEERRREKEALERQGALDRTSQAIIDREISERIRKLEVIDKQRNDRLQALEAEAAATS